MTSANEGIPAEQLDTFLAKGYNLNDRVGKSYLEQQYEDVLHGYKTKVKKLTDQTGNILDTKVISNGQRGNDLVLAIEMDLQLAVEKIIEEELLAAKKWPVTSLLDRAYVVLMYPRTGEILTMAGKKMMKNKETGQIEMVDDALGNFSTTYNVVSTVKGVSSSDELKPSWICSQRKSRDRDGGDCSMGVSRKRRPSCQFKNRPPSHGCIFPPA